MKFQKGDIVKLIGYEKSFLVEVSHYTDEQFNSFEGVIIETEFNDDEFNGSCRVGVVDDNFDEEQFVAVERNK